VIPLDRVRRITSAASTCPTIASRQLRPNGKARPLGCGRGKFCATRWRWRGDGRICSAVEFCYAAPAMYRAKRPQTRQRSVTCERGGGGDSFGSRSIGPEHDGQL